MLTARHTPAIQKNQMSFHKGKFNFLKRRFMQGKKRYGGFYPRSPLFI